MAADPAIMDLATKVGGGGVLLALLAERVIHALRGGVGKGLAAMKAQTASLDHMTQALADTTATVEALRDTQQTIQAEVSDLHASHAVTDQDGVPVWYVRRSMETALEGVTDNMQKVATVLDRLVDRVEHITRS